MKDEVNYPIGWGKPPKRTQFQKGVSGNPKGRPKGSKNLRTIFWQITHEKVKVNGPRGPKWITKLEAGITQLANRAAQGDPKAIRELIHWSRTFGDVNPLGPAPILNIHFRSAEKNKPAEERPGK